VWIRGLIRPSAGDALAYVDWSQQEFGIAAALSGDRQMQEAYLSGDAYLAFGKQAGLIPPEGTKETHKLQRERCKACVLGTQYGIGVHSLAQRLNQSPAHARELLLLHRKAYPDFWKWSDLVVDFAMLHGYLRTCFGWRLHVTSLTKATALRNFLMQAHGAEILRLACILATEQGIEVAAPVHDALLVVAPLERIEAVVVETQKVMAQAGEIVLDGFQLRSEAKIVRHPDRYMDPRGEVMWARVWKIIEELENDE
jgi:DNA polymerase I-like protein with 3'-5' exonuclease and polymerase domains